MLNVNGDWRIVRRQPIYEKDGRVPVRPGATLDFDEQVLERFPVGYRYLAYIQSKSGFDVADNLPDLTGLVVENLYAEGRSWLAGSETAGIPLQKGWLALVTDLDSSAAPVFLGRQAGRIQVSAAAPVI